MSKNESGLGMTMTVMEKGIKIIIKMIENAKQFTVDTMKLRPICSNNNLKQQTLKRLNAVEVVNLMKFKYRQDKLINCQRCFF